MSTSIVRSYPVTLATDASTNYASGDVIEGVQVVDTGLGELAVLVTSMSVVDRDGVTPAVKVIFLNGPQTVAADNAAYAPTDADLLNEGTESVTVAAGDYTSYSGNGKAEKAELKCTVLLQGGMLRFLVLADGAINFSSAAGLSVRVALLV